MDNGHRAAGESFPYSMEGAMGISRANHENGASRLCFALQANFFWVALVYPPASLHKPDVHVSIFQYC